MTLIKFLRDQGQYVPSQNLYDSALQTGAIDIDADGYTVALDRVYNVKGLNNMHTEIENTGGANGLTYTIEGSSKQYAGNDPVGLVADADYDEVIIGDTNVAFGTTDKNDIIDISPELTTIRIRVKRQTSALDTTLAGIVNIN